MSDNPDEPSGTSGQPQDQQSTPSQTVQAQDAPPQGAQHQGTSAGGQPTGQQRTTQQAGQTESITNAIQRPAPKGFIKGITGIMGAMGLLLGIAVYLVGSLGGRSLFPGLAQEMSGTPGVQESLSFSHQLIMAYVANELSIFLAFLMAPVFGLLVAYKLDDTQQAKMGAAGVGVAFGTIAFTFLLVLLASFVTPSPSELIAAQESLPGASTFTSQQQMVQGMDLGSIDIGNTLINSIAAAVPTGAAAAAVIYFEENFFS